MDSEASPSRSSTSVGRGYFHSRSRGDTTSRGSRGDTTSRGSRGDTTSRGSRDTTSRGSRGRKIGVIPPPADPARKPWKENTVESESSEEAPIISTDDIAVAYTHLMGYSESHMYGFSSTHKTEQLVRRILSSKKKKSSEVHFVCYKTKDKTIRKYENIAKTSVPGGSGDNVVFDPLVGISLGKNSADYHSKVEDVSRVIYCTTRKMINILLKRRNDTTEGTLGSIGSIIIDSWDEYDSSAYVLFGLARELARNLDKRYSLILVSVSRWISLVATLETLELYDEGKKIAYTTQTSVQLADQAYRANNRAIAYLPSADMSKVTFDVENDVVLLASHLAKDKDTHLVIDSMKNQHGLQATKQLADLRANSIENGVIIRCISEAGYNRLPDSSLPREKVGLDSLLIYLLNAKFSQAAIKSMLTEEHQKDVATFFKEFSAYKLDKAEIRLIQDTGLNIKAGIFLNLWVASLERVTNRSMYAGILCACLINHKPQLYADAAAYSKFAGRNDLETMCNMWLNLISSVPVPFVFWNRPKNSSADWALRRGFDADAILDLYTLVRTICVKMLTDKSSIRKEGTVTSKVSYGYNVFNKLTVDEINDAVSILCKLFPVREGKWRSSDVLPCTNDLPRVIHPIHYKADTLYMYVSDTILRNFEAQAEYLDHYLAIDY